MANPRSRIPDHSISDPESLIFSRQVPDARPRSAALPTTSTDERAARRSLLYLWRVVIVASVLFARMNTPVESQVSGLVAAYGFDEGAGTSIADASGNN